MKLSNAIALLAGPLSVLAAATTTTTSAVAAGSSPNPFNIPSAGLSANAGDTLHLKWQPTTPGNVNLILRSGPQNSLSTVSTIAANIPNSGSYSWSVPSDTVRGSSYAVEIQSSDDTSMVNYTPPFAIDSSHTSANSTSASSSSASSSSGSMSSSNSTSTSSTGSASSSNTMSGKNATVTHHTSRHSSTGASATQSGASGSMGGATGGAFTGPTSTSVKPSASTGAAARATAIAGVIGFLALGAFAL